MTIPQIEQLIALMGTKGVTYLRMADGTEIRLGPTPMAAPVDDAPEDEQPAITRAEDDPVTFGGRLPGLKQYAE